MKGIPKNDDAPKLGRDGASAGKVESPHHTAPVFTITLRPTPQGPDPLGRMPVDRLRGALKLLARGFGLRAVEVREGVRP